MSYTHDELVERGRKWLASKGPVTVTEIVTAAGEEPDVLSFETSLKNGRSHIGYGSVLIECKASRSDFKADGKKFYRRSPKHGMGDYRFFMAPKGLIGVDELPENWGLLEVAEKGRVKMMKEPKRYDSNKRNEITVLVSTLRRLKLAEDGHVSIRVYNHETKNKASLTISEGAQGEW